MTLPKQSSNISSAAERQFFVSITMLARNKLEFLLTLLLLILVVAVWQTSQLPLANEETKDFTITVLNGFWTAFFALIFLGISSILQKVTTRERQHYNSLVNLSTQLNEMIGLIKDNVYTMKGFREGIIRGNIHWGNIRPIFIDKSHLENLYDIDLINKVFEFFYQVRKINDDMENLQNGYNDLKNAYIQKQINVDHYVQNAVLIAKELETLELFSEELSEQLNSLLTRVRIQTGKDKPLTSKILDKLIYTSGNRITMKEFEKEKLQLEEELESSFKASQRQIQKTLRKKKK